MNIKTYTPEYNIKKFYSNPDVQILKNLIDKATGEDLQALKYRSQLFKDYLDKKDIPEKQQYLIFDFNENVIKNFIIELSKQIMSNTI